jgi:tripartite-type tricarboxylate transporter receptor subunit TctC
MITRRSLLITPLALAAAAGAIGSAAAQTYPARAIRMIVPFPPAGPIDTMARLLAQQLSLRFAQQVVIDNRPGAGSLLGTKAAAGAEPDGYTLLFGSSGSLAVAPALYSNYDLDILKAFVPIGSVALLPHVLVISPSVPAKTVAEFVAYAKANPGKLNYGASIGTPPHLLSTLFKSKAGIDVVYVPYKGSAASVTDLLSGQTQFTIDGLTGLYPLIQDGKVRALALARAALAGAAGRADLGGERLCGFHRRCMDRRGGTGRHAGRDRHPAQPRDQPKPGVRGGEGRLGALQRHRTDRLAAGIRRIDRRRAAEMGGDRQIVGSQDRLKAHSRPDQSIKRKGSK